MTEVEEKEWKKQIEKAEDDRSRRKGREGKQTEKAQEMTEAEEKEKKILWDEEEKEEGNINHIKKGEEENKKTRTFNPTRPGSIHPSRPLW